MRDASQFQHRTLASETLEFRTERRLSETPRHATSGFPGGDMQKNRDFPLFNRSDRMKNRYFS